MDEYRSCGCVVPDTEAPVRCAAHAPMTGYERAICPVCRQSTVVVPVPGAGVDLRRRLVRHTRPDWAPVAWVKRLWPWSSAPLCGGTNRLIVISPPDPPLPAA